MVFINNNQEKNISNQSRVFKVIYQNEKVAKQDIANLLAISLPTVTQNLDYLIDIGLVTEVGEFKSRGGRKAKAISYVREYKYAIGLDITKNHVGIVLINLAGEIISYTRLEKTFHRSQEYFQGIGFIIQQFISDQKVAEEKVIGVGISIPGILDEKRNKIVYSHPLGISNVNCREFTEFINYSCKFCNDANAACIAEMWNKEVASNVVYLSLSNSVSGAIMFNKQLYLGDNQRSAEFGHMTLVPGGKRCYCGKNGCVDAYCSAYLLTENTFSKLEDFFETLQNGDEHCRYIWDEYLRNLALTINSIRMAFDCDIIVGGYVGSYLNNYIQILRKKVAILNPFEEDAHYLIPCSYKIEASAVGAALLNIELFINNL